MIKPLNKNVILEKEKVENTTASGIILTGEQEQVSNVAKVISVSKDVSADISENMKVVYKEYAGTSLKMDEKEYIVISEEDVLAIIE